VYYARAESEQVCESECHTTCSGALHVGHGVTICAATAGPDCARAHNERLRAVNAVTTHNHSARHLHDLKTVTLANKHGQCARFTCPLLAYESSSCMIT
jgi:hypothetical protein